MCEIANIYIWIYVINLMVRTAKLRLSHVSNLMDFDVFHFILYMLKEIINCAILLKMQVVNIRMHGNPN
jgi:hypothetical protein